jgi:hypothetical protein
MPASVSVRVQVQVQARATTNELRDGACTYVVVHFGWLIDNGTGK